MNRIIALIFCVCFFTIADAQEDLAPNPSSKGEEKNNPQQTTKGTFYITGGYNFDWFAKSNLHFKDHSTNDYDFTLYDVKATDKKNEIKYVFSEDITIPQYSFRIGYWLNNKSDLGIELSYDHAKYVMIRNQNLHLKGEIHGQEFDQDTIVGADFLTYEHTNGANFCIVNIIKRKNLLHSKNNKFWLSAIGKYGFGFVYPRSDVTIFGVNRNDKYHVAGYITAIDVGFRFDFLKHFFLETTGKGVFANYSNVLVTGNGRAKQKIYGFEYIALCGLQIPM